MYLINKCRLMALVQIVNEFDPSRTIIRDKYAIEYNISNFTWVNNDTMKAVFLRIGDIASIAGIVFETDIETDELCNKIKNIRIEIGGVTIITLDKQFLLAISTIDKIDNEILFNIDFSPFIDNIPLVALQFHEVCAKITFNDSTGFSSVKLVSSDKYLDSEDRRNLARSNTILPIQQLEGNTMRLNEETHITTMLSIKGNCKGYFIYGDINNIQNITLKYDRNIRYSYSKLMLRLVSKRISDTLLYIPYDINTDWKNRDIVTYRSSFNHSNNVYSISMDIQFSSPQTKIGIYGLRFNNLIITNGLATLQDVTSGYIHSTGDFYGDSSNTGLIWNTAIKRIFIDKSYCSITHDNIVEGNEYCECTSCRNCFIAEQLKTYFTSARFRNCPLCRQVWANYTVYTNNDE